MEQHWAYPTSHPTWASQHGRGIKRAISESDCEDVYSEGSSKEQ